MAGNVWQWCSDWFDVSLYRKRAGQGVIVNPTGPAHSYNPDQSLCPGASPARRLVFMHRRLLLALPPQRTAREHAGYGHVARGVSVREVAVGKQNSRSQGALRYDQKLVSQCSG